MNLQHVHFLFYTTLNIVDIGKFAHKIISVNFLRNHTGQLPDIWHRASVWRTVSCNAVLNLQHVHFLFLTRLWIFKRKEIGRRHMSSLEDLLLSYTLNILGETTQREPTQHECVFGTKPPSAKTYVRRETTWIFTNFTAIYKCICIAFAVQNFFKFNLLLASLGSSPWNYRRPSIHLLLNLFFSYI